jgi:hypothetical protein
VTGNVTANGGPDDRSCSGRGVFAVSTTKLVANHAANDCAYKLAAMYAVVPVIHGVVLGIPPALLNRTPDVDVVNNRLCAENFRIGIRRTGMSPLSMCIDPAANAQQHSGCRQSCYYTFRIHGPHPFQIPNRPFASLGTRIEEVQ